MIYFRLRGRMNEKRYPVFNNFIYTNRTSAISGASTRLDRIRIRSECVSFSMAFGGYENMTREKREIPSSLASLLLVICQFFAKKWQVNERSEFTRCQTQKCPQCVILWGLMGSFVLNKFFKNQPQSPGDKCALWAEMKNK